MALGCLGAQVWTSPSNKLALHRYDFKFQEVPIHAKSPKDVSIILIYAIMYLSDQNG